MREFSCWNVAFKRNWWFESSSNSPICAQVVASLRQCESIMALQGKRFWWKQPNDPQSDPGTGQQPPAMANGSFTATEEKKAGLIMRETLG